ncbi:TonB-dependent receptor [Chitinophaga sp. Mgbs1]|uniref:TonB-dependent receptor n=1 Tax=Chitinophaga solisilvae TaxID=1233460 RepID=A0A9Q5CZ45_9BACT|nr:TonB-dependent receptor [Chitinophaga solisilvae]
MKSAILLLSILMSLQYTVFAQQAVILQGNISTVQGIPVERAGVYIPELQRRTVTDENGHYRFGNIAPGNYVLKVSLTGYQTASRQITVNAQHSQHHLTLEPNVVELQPLTVTAEKKVGNLQQVPMAVSAITGKQVEERKINEVSDLLLSVPNLMTMNMGAPTLSVIAIRGVLTFSTDPAVGVYMDGVPMFDGYSSSMQLMDIARVEVLRGPQSTLYGRTGLGGVINIITRKPGNIPRGFVSAGLGNFGSQQYNLGLSGPLIKNRLFAGFTGRYDSHTGYYTNLYTGKKYDRPETYSGSFYARYLAGERFSLTLNAKAEYNNVAGAFPYVVNADSALKYPYTLRQNGANQERRKLYTGSLTAQYRLKGAQISAITAYTYLSDLYKDYDVDYTPYDITTFEMPLQDQKTWTQELRIVTDNNAPLQFTGGVFGFIDRKQTHTIYNYGPDAAMMDPRAPYTSNINTDKKVNGIAAYANLTYTLSERWKVSAGLRYDYESRSLLTSTDFVKEPQSPVIVRPEQTIKGHNGAFSPRLNVSYMPATDLQLYASYTRGYRPGGFNQYTLNTDRLNYKPEYTDNYEVGIKSEWLQHRLRANAALFYTSWKDQQQTLMAPENLIDNVGRLSNQGGELELTGLPLKGLEIGYNLGVVRSSYQQLLLLDGSGGNKDFKGNKQVFTPSFTSALSVTYRRSFYHDKCNIYITPEWKYLGRQYMNYYNDLEQAPFSLLNATIGIRYAPIEISFWGKNLADVRYLSFAYATQPRATTPVLLGTPRTYGMSVKASF